MKNELIETSVPGVAVHIYDYIHTSSNHIPISDIHYHDEIELLSITGGSLTFTVNGISYVAKKGQIVFFNSRIPHATARNGCPCTYTLVQFKPEAFVNAEERPACKHFYRFVSAYDTPFRLLENTNISEHIASILAEYKGHGEGRSIFITADIYAIIATLVRIGLLADESGFSSADIEKIAPALEYIEENYNRGITLPEISSVQGLNHSYFCRLFKRASGSSFTDYLNFVRICKSEKMLADGTKSVIEVAYDVGFSSVSYFNRVFKRLKNCTPTEYRRAQYKHM